MKTPPSISEPETTFVTVVTMEEVPVPTGEERAELLVSLEEAEADIAAGRGTDFDREIFRARFMAICRGEFD